MQSALIRTGLLAAVIAVSGCASLTPPERPAYSGADTVSSVEASQLVGSWRVNELNPIPNSEPQQTTIEYLSDGTVRGTVVPQGESAAAMGETTFELTGNWQVEGDTVVHENMEMTANSDNPVVTMMARMINSRQGISGQANIYELTADRMVMVGEEGSAMEYLRQ